MVYPSWSKGALVEKCLFHLTLVGSSKAELQNTFPLPFLHPDTALVKFLSIGAHDHLLRPSKEQASPLENLVLTEA